MRIAFDTMARDARRHPLRYIQWLPHQLSFLRDPAKEKLLRTGNQLGKSFCGLADIIMEMLDEHPWLKCPGDGAEAWVICSSFSQSIAIQKKAWELVPKERVTSAPFDSKTGFGHLNPLIKFDNGSLIRFKTCNQDTIDLASATIHSSLFDEPPKNPRVYTEIQKRVQEMNGRVLIAMTPINARVDWLRERVNTLTDDDTPLISEHYARFEPETFIPVDSDRPLLLGDGTPKDQKWIDSIVAKTISIERGVTLHGEWEMRSEGAVFKAFRQAWKTPPTRVTVRVGIDHGSGRNFSQCALICYVAGPRGNETVWVRSEYVSQHTTTADDDAMGMLDALRRAGLTWRKVDTAFGDKIHHGGRGGRDRKANKELHAAIARQLRTTAGTLEPYIHNAKRHGVQRGRVSRDVQWLHEAMTYERLFVHPECTGLISSLEQWDYRPRQDDKRAHKASRESDFKHLIDCLRYALRTEMGVTRRTGGPALTLG